MTDEDMAEQHALWNELPQASLLLCFFHVLRAIVEKWPVKCLFMDLGLLEWNPTRMKP